MSPTTLDDLYEGDDLPDEWPVRAIETMPFWGQLLAWLSWRMPLKVYAIGAVAGLGVCFVSLVGGVVMALVSLALFFWGFYCRTNVRSPWSFVVLQTREPVPMELRRAAMEGRPAPEEHPDVLRETQT